MIARSDLYIYNTAERSLSCLSLSLSLSLSLFRFRPTPFLNSHVLQLVIDTFR
jgi:hypothetical protein